MTARLINGAEFLHIPKTGGSWVREILRKNNLVAENLVYKHADYDVNLFRELKSPKSLLRRGIRSALRSGPRLRRLLRYWPEAEEKSVFRFCFVRHPLSWYESWWRFMLGCEWREWGVQNSRKQWHPNAILNGLGSDDFNQFVRNVVQERPGYVSELMFAYTKPGISFIGKTENLREDLAHVLDLLELPYDQASIEQSPRANISWPDAPDAQWDPELRATVMRLELPALLHFQYLSEEEKAELGINMPIKPHKALRQVVPLLIPEDRDGQGQKQ